MPSELYVTMDNPAYIFYQPHTTYPAPDLTCTWTLTAPTGYRLFAQVFVFSSPTDNVVLDFETDDASVEYFLDSNLLDVVTPKDVNQIAVSVTSTKPYDDILFITRVTATNETGESNLLIGLSVHK